MEGVAYSRLAWLVYSPTCLINSLCEEVVCIIIRYKTFSLFLLSTAEGSSELATTGITQVGEVTQKAAQNPLTRIAFYFTSGSPDKAGMKCYKLQSADSF